MKVQLVQPTARYKRGHRRPQLRFNLHALPWQIVPMFIHPVIPGETMRKLSHLSRTVSDPVNDKLMGAHIEHSYFYVKHTDLEIGNDLIEMHLDEAKDMSSLKVALANRLMFRSASSQLDFVQMCLRKVVEWYFMDEGRTYGTYTIGGLPVAKVNQLGWWQSAKKASENNEADHELPGDITNIPTNIPAGFENHYIQWERMVAASLTDATFEDYLATFGVRAPKNLDEEEKRPELLRHVRQWTYPTNTVEPTTGTPSSAWIWSNEHDASKDRFFKEPGFIFGVQVIRPKVLFSNITGTLVNHMDTAYNWLPAVLQDLDFTSLKEFSSAYPGALSAVDAGENVWLDLKDLLLYGEQFVNHDMTEGTAKAALPGTNAAFETEYPVEADATGLFVGTTAATRRVRTDGIVTLDIASSVHKDTSG